MNAGRELDALVAEKVMGATLTGPVGADYIEGEWTVWGAPSGNQRVEPSCLRHCLCENTDKYYADHPDRYRGHSWESKNVGGHYPPCVMVVPRYSTSIAAAWEVVEKLRAMNSTLELYSPGALVNDEMGIHAVEWQATFKSWEEPWGPHGPSVEAQTAPHAICLAALKAVGVTA